MECNLGFYLCVNIKKKKKGDTLEVSEEQILTIPDHIFKAFKV